MVYRIRSTAVVGKADNVSSVSASACHIGGPNSVSLRYSFLYTICSKADIFCKGSGIGKTVAYQRKPKISFSIMDRFELCYRISDFPELVDRPGGVCLSDLRLDPRLRPFRNQQPVPRQLKHRAGSPLQRQGRLGKPPRLSIFQVSGIHPDI